MPVLSSSRLILVTAIGGCLEFFDFTIFALFSTYISQAFFPFAEHLTSLINTFAIFAMGYFARPLGGLLISHIGDRYGRKKGLLIAVNLMALTTLLIAILPGYKQIGVMAPILLLILRLLQGAAVGGEIPGVITYLTEFFHAKRPVLAIAIILAAVTFGNVLASALGYLLSRCFSSTFMMTWGWRIPFLIGAALGFIGYIIRRRTQETIIFIRLVAEHATHRQPAYQVMKSHSLKILLAAGMTAMTSATVFLFLYLPVFLHTVLHHTIQNAYLMTTTGFIVLGLATAGWGYLAEKITPIRLAIIGCLFVSILSVGALFWISIFNSMILFVVILALVAAMTNSSYTIVISRLFKPSIRYSGVAIAYNVGVACFGAIAPVCLMSIYQSFHVITAPFWFLILASLISFVCFVIQNKAEADV